jgi:uncharacterized Fe-S cluster protein YjdI
VNKPFCDGTYSTIGFGDRNAADTGRDKGRSYTGKHITILDNRSICSHAGFSTDQLKSVFRHRGEPWIDPDGVEVETIATITKCPSGALSYAIGGVEAEPHRSGRRWSRWPTTGRMRYQAASSSWA